MLFEKLVEQHRIHLVVAHTVRFSFLVAHDEVRIDLFDILGDESELRCACRIKLLLVAEANWFKCKERFAEFVHWLDVFLITIGGSQGTELIVSIDEDSTAQVGGLAKDATD